MSTSPPKPPRQLYSDAFQQQVLAALEEIARQQELLTTTVRETQGRLDRLEEFSLATRKIGLEATASLDIDLSRQIANRTAALGERIAAAEGSLAELRARLSDESRRARAWERGLLIAVVVVLLCIGVAMAVEAGVAIYVQFIAPGGG